MSSDTATFTLPFSQIVRELPQPLADTILAYAQEESRETFAGLMSVQTSTLKFRPNIWRTWPKPRQREWLWANLRQPRFADTARQLLQEWFFTQRARMLTLFLDALGIAHSDEGYITEAVTGELDADKVRAGVDALLKEFPANEVSLYLRIFQYSRSDESGWKSIADLLASDPRLADASPPPATASAA